VHIWQIGHGHLDSRKRGRVHVLGTERIRWNQPSTSSTIRRGNELCIRIRDLEGYGGTLILDGMTSDGRRIMI
jgi:hypothetical protein